MEFFSDNWPLWTSVLVPSALFIAAEKALKKPSRAGDVARVAAAASAFMLVIAAIHVVVEFAVGLLIP